MQSVRTEYAIYKYISFDKIVRKFVAKLLKLYRILSKDILTFLECEYRDALQFEVLKRHIL